mgnify:CR=1 FL=1
MRTYMDNRKKYNSCTAVIGTLTAAQRAQKVLASAAIPSRVEKSESVAGQRGCVWCVSFSCSQRQNVASVLAAAGVRVRSWEE